MRSARHGKTAIERNKGKKATVMGIEFGEKVLHKKKFKDKSSKIEPRWEKGIIVGIRLKSGEFWIATPDGIKKIRSVRRLPFEARWGADSLTWVRHVPWHLYRGDDQADGDIPEEQIVDPAPEDASRGQVLQGEGQQPIVVKMRAAPPRAFQIRKEDA